MTPLGAELVGAGLGDELAVGGAHERLPERPGPTAGLRKQSSAVERPSSSTVSAGADHLDGVGNVDKAVLVCHAGGPTFHLWAFDFDRTPTTPTDEVVVMLVSGTAPIAGFAIVSTEGVELAVLGEGAELVVDGGESDVLASGCQLGVQILSRAEPVRGV